jgi:hypothetical protein
MGTVQPCRLSRVVVLALVAALAGGCTNTLFYGESTEFNLAIHLNDNPQQPLELNMGLKRHAGQVTPPIATEQNEAGTAAVGEAVTTLSGFRLRYQDDSNSISPLSNDLYIRTQFATGAAAAELAKNPIEAVKVMRADFERPADFPSPASQARHDRIVGAIKALDDATATAMACHPPIHNSQTRMLADKSDPLCESRRDPAFARKFLVQASFEDDRTDEAFEGWETALNLPPN